MLKPCPRARSGEVNVAWVMVHMSIQLVSVLPVQKKEKKSSGTQGLRFAYFKKKVRTRQHNSSESKRLRFSFFYYIRVCIYSSCILFTRETESRFTSLVLMKRKTELQEQLKCERASVCILQLGLDNRVHQVYRHVSSSRRMCRHVENRLSLSHSL